MQHLTKYSAPITNVSAGSTLPFFDVNQRANTVKRGNFEISLEIVRRYLCYKPGLLIITVSILHGQQCPFFKRVLEPGFFKASSSMFPLQGWMCCHHTASISSLILPYSSHCKRYVFKFKPSKRHVCPWRVAKQSTLERYSLSDEREIVGASSNPSKANQPEQFFERLDCKAA